MQKTKEYFQKNPIADENDYDNPDYADMLHFSKSENMRWFQGRKMDRGWDELFEYYQQSYDRIIKFGTAPEPNLESFLQKTINDAQEDKMFGRDQILPAMPAIADKDPLKY